MEGFLKVDILLASLEAKEILLYYVYVLLVQGNTYEYEYILKTNSTVYASVCLFFT